jgi:hypothetical protein
VPYPDARDHLDEGIEAEAEESDRFVFEAEEYRDQTLGGVIENSYQSEYISPLIKVSLLSEVKDWYGHFLLVRTLFLYSGF